MLRFKKKKKVHTRALDSEIVCGTGKGGMSVSTRSSVSTTCSLSGDEDSTGITTTGLMCSDRADARRKFGGFCREKVERL